MDEEDDLVHHGRVNLRGLACTEQNHQVVKASGPQANVPLPCRRRRRAGVWRTEWSNDTQEELGGRGRKSPSSGERKCRRAWFPKYPEETERFAGRGSRDQEERVPPELWTAGHVSQNS